MPKRPAAKPSPSGPFFANRLKGETPLSGPTARALYHQAVHLFDISLWDVLSGDNPIWLQLPSTPTPVLVSVMGNAGEVFGFQCYENPAGHEFISQLLNDEAPDVPTFLAERQLLSLEYGWKKDLRAEDKAFLEAIGHPRSYDRDNPVFRSAYPGRPEWFLNEEEGLRLKSYLDAILWFDASHTDDEIEATTQHQDWPCIQHDTNGYRLIYLPRPLPAERPLPIIPPTLFDSLLERLQTLPAQKQGVLELVSETNPSTVGPITERPVYGHLVLIAEAKSGFIFSPSFSSAAGDSTEATLNALAKAFLERGSLPTELRYRNRLPYLKPFLGALGIAAIQTESLPACDAALDSMRDFGLY